MKQWKCTKGCPGYFSSLQHGGNKCPFCAAPLEEMLQGNAWSSKEAAPPGAVKLKMPEVTVEATFAQLETSSALLEAAWSIIANVAGGDWDRADVDPAWRAAAVHWRASYETLKRKRVAQSGLLQRIIEARGRNWANERDHEIDLIFEALEVLCAPPGTATLRREGSPEKVVDLEGVCAWCGAPGFLGEQGAGRALHWRAGVARVCIDCFNRSRLLSGASVR